MDWYNRYIGNNDPEDYPEQDDFDNSFLDYDDSDSEDVARTWDLEEIEFLIALERNSEVLSIESDVKDAKETMDIINMMATDQGEDLNLLEDHIDDAEMYVESAKEELSKYEQWCNFVRKNKLILGSSATALVALTVVPTIVGIANQKKKKALDQETNN